MAGKRFRPALESPYRWRDWAAKADGVTGDELISFVNNEEAVRPDGKKGPGLFAYLRGLARRQRRRPARCHRHGFQRHDQPDDQRLPAARRDQQSQRHPLHQQRRDPHPRPSLRVHAQRDARRRRRLRRVLHAARRRPLHSRSHEPQARRSDPRPGLRHRRLSRRVVQAPGEAVQDGRGSADSARRKASSAARPSRCRICWRR